MFPLPNPNQAEAAFQAAKKKAEAQEKMAQELKEAEELAAKQKVRGNWIVRKLNCKV